jgi:hypothetical protein
LAQEQETEAPDQESVADTTKTESQTQPEQIRIRIELPIVEPLFDIYYSREEPRIETDEIAPIANPLQSLPTTVEEVTEKKFQAKKLEKPEILLNRPRE